MPTEAPTKELGLFVAERITPTIDAFIKGKHRLTDIQRHYGSNIREMRRLYGRDPGISMHPYPPEGITGERSVSYAACVVTRDGAPRIMLFVEPLADMFRQMRQMRVPFVKRFFEGFLIVSLLHETDHLAKELISTPGSLASHLENERLAWAETSTHVLTPLIEVHNFGLHPEDRACYDHWKRAEQNPEHELWRRFISAKHEQFLLARGCT